LARRGARTLFCGLWTFGVEVLEYQSFYESRILNEVTLYFGKTIIFTSHVQTPQNKALAILLA